MKGPRKSRVAAISYHHGYINNIVISRLQQFLRLIDTQIAQIQAGRYARDLLEPAVIVGHAVILHFRQLADRNRQVIVLVDIADRRDSAILDQLTV